MALIHWWPLNGNIKDYITGKTYEYKNLTSIANGRIGSAYSFNGSDSYISLPTDLNSILSGGNQPHTIAFWIYVNEQNSRGIIIGNYSRTTGSSGYNIEYYSSTSNTIRYWYNSNPDWNAGVSFDYKTWNHFAFVYDGSKVSIFKNGALVASRSGVLTAQSHTSNFLMGRDGRTGDTVFNGYLNDFRIYDEALSDKEVKKISQGLILHYNPDYAIRSSCWTGSYNFGRVGGSGFTQSTISDSSLPSGDYRKLTWTANGGKCGPYFLNIWPSTNGATYTTSFYWKSYGYTPRLNAENYSSWKAYTTKAPNGWWYTQIVGTYNSSTTYDAITFYAVPANGTACELDVSSIKIEPGDFATPYRRDNKSYIPDASGFGHDGTIVSEAIEKSTDHKYKKNIVADGNPAHYIQSDINPSFLTSGVTFNVWYKNVTNKTFLLANGETNAAYVMAMNDDNKWCGFVSGEAYYIDGQLRTKTDGYPKDGQWHMYTFVGTSLVGGYWTALYWNRHDATWAYNGPLGDIRLYATALSAADVKALYNETRVTHPMQFLISNSSALSSLTSSNPVLADGELVVVRSTDAAGKTYFNIRKGNGVNNFNSLPWKQISETVLKGWRDSFSSDSTALAADTNSYTQLG